MDKSKVYNKWQSVLGNIDNEKSDWLEDYTRNICGPISTGNTTNTTNINSNSWGNIALPLVKRVMATTLASGGWYKSKKQQLKENRINKLRKVQGLDPNVVLPDDVYQDGLVSVKPMAAPSGMLFYIDFKYDPGHQKRTQRKNKLNKLNNLIRIDKIKYIEEIISKNN